MNQQTVDPASRPRQAFGFNEIRDIVAHGRRNRWITWSEVAHVTLKRGIIDHSLHVELNSGHREKFLWLSADGGYDVLEIVARATAAVGASESGTSPFG